MKFENTMQKSVVKSVKYNKDNPNYSVLESSKIVESGWKKYQKFGGSWALRLTKKIYIKSKENRVGQEAGNKGDWLVMGVEGEEWFMDDKTFNKKYNKSESDDVKVDANGYSLKYHKVKSGSPVLAIPMYKGFNVISNWSDEPLSGKVGDYLVKNFSDASNPDPKDVWIVDKTIFSKTYKEI